MIVSPWFFYEVVRHSPGSDAATYRPVQVLVKETSAIGWISRLDHPYPPDAQKLDRAAARPAGAAAAEVPHQLPAYPPHFVGRDDELAQLTRLLDDAIANGEGTVVLAIDGTAGGGQDGAGGMITFRLEVDAVSAWPHRDGDSHQTCSRPALPARASTPPIRMTSTTTTTIRMGIVFSEVLTDAEISRPSAIDTTASTASAQTPRQFGLEPTARRCWSPIPAPGRRSTSVSFRDRRHLTAAQDGELVGNAIASAHRDGPRSRTAVP